MERNERSVTRKDTDMQMLFFFILIGLARIIESLCNKRTSSLVTSRTKFFAYGAYYEAASAAFSLIALVFAGFYGFDGITVLCAAAQGLMFIFELFTNLAAIRGGTLILCNMFAMGGLIIPCVAGIFLFDEAMSLGQWAGLALFIVSAAILASDSNKTNVKLTPKTLVLLIVNLLVNGGVMIFQKVFALYRPDGNVALYSFLTFAINAVVLSICLLVRTLINKRTPALTGAAPEPGVSGNENADTHTRFEKILYLYGALLALAIFTLNLLVTMLAKTVPSVVLFPVSACIAITVTTLIGAIVFKEKLTLRKIIGIAFGIGSIVIINLL